MKPKEIRKNHPMFGIDVAIVF